jgi:alcohol dehydrogenase
MPDLGVLRPPATILFGTEAVLNIGAVAVEHGRRIVICTDQHLAGSAHLPRLVQLLEAAGADVRVIAGAEPELPLPAVEATISAAKRHDPQCIVGFGGGSCIDLAKLVALGIRFGLPLSRWYGENAVSAATRPVIAVPTTAGTGSEVTPVAVLTDPGRAMKVGISSPYLIPRAAVCDPDLTHGAPPEVTAYAGIDALAHAVEAHCARRRHGWNDIGGRLFVGRNVLSDVFALQAIRLIGPALAGAMGDRVEARESMARGSLFAGLAFATAGTTFAHALQYPIGALTGTPHGLGVGLLLPFTMAFNARASVKQTAEVADALNAGDDARAAVGAVRKLSRSVGIPGSLSEIGVTRAMLPTIADRALEIRRLVENNPRPIDRAGAMTVLEYALDGDPVELLAESRK